MSKVEVLVACMNQMDDGLYSEMNLHTDAVFANQCEAYDYKEYYETDGSLVKLISTSDRGVGKNRNKALLFASGEYLLCADQDMVYVDEYAKIVEDAFKRQPDADLIVFELKYRNRFTPARKKGTKFKRVHLWNCMRYGTARVAMRRNAVDKACLSFSTLYGGGAHFSSGEDSLFIRNAFSKKLKMYASPVTIAEVKQEESSWFRGYTDKFFTDKGVWLANAFPLAKHILKFYFGFQLRKLSIDHSLYDIVKLMEKGFVIYKKL